MKRILIAFFLTSIVTACFIDPWILTNSPTDKVTVTKVTKYAYEDDGITPQRSLVGEVVFSHQTHSFEEMGLECVDCHHKVNNPERIKECAVCHKGYDGFDVLHGLCEGCHQKNDGPLECKQCH